MIRRENWKIGNQIASFFILFDTFNPHIYFFHHSVKNYFFKGEMIFGENIHPLICVNFSGVNVAVQYHTSTVLKILSLILQGQIDPNRRNLIFKKLCAFDSSLHNLRIIVCKIFTIHSWLIDLSKSAESWCKIKHPIQEQKRHQI